VVGLVPQRVGRIAETVEKRPIRSFSIGVVATVVLSLAALLFAITFVGLPVSFLIIAGMGLAWLMGFVGLCQALGDRMPFEQKHHGRWIAFLVASLGVTFLGVLPWVGWLVLFGGSAVGIGAALQSRLGGRV
jgi:hypothetical protein